MDGQANEDDDMSAKVKIKTEKGEIPTKYSYKDKNIEKENRNNPRPDTEKAKLHADLLEHCQQELKTVKEKLIQTEKQLEKSNAYNEELRDELDKLNSELHILKRATKEKIDVETQTDNHQDDFHERDGLSRDQAIVIDDSMIEGHENETGEDAKMADGAKTLVTVKTDDSAIEEKCASVENDSKPKDDNKMESVDKIDKEGKQEEEKASSTSLADELRATAEAVVQQTGYVYDENSGLYYDYNSGYYYNAEKALYYDPNTGTYFYYNSESGKYEFHSQVDVSQYSTNRDSTQYNYHDHYHHRDHYSRGGNQPRRDYHTSHRHNDSGYDQYHRSLPRRDRQTSRSSKSYVEYDDHTPQRRDKSSYRMDSDQKKRLKRLQSEEREYHKRKKKKKDKKKKKRKSSKEKRRDKSPEKKSDEKCSDDKKRKDRESREKCEEGEVRSEDDDSKEGDEDKENSDDEESYDLAGNSKSYMDELYESFDENSNEVTSEEDSTIDNLYDDLGEENFQQCVSGDDVLSKSTEDYLKPEDHKHSKNNDSNMELSPTNTDNVNTTHSKQTEYSEHKKKQSSNDSSCNTTGKFRRKKSSSFTDIDTTHKKSHHNKKENTLHRNDLSTSSEHRSKKSRSSNSHKYEYCRSGNCKNSKDQLDNKYLNKHGETLDRKQDGDFSETKGKKHQYISGKQGRKSSVNRHDKIRKTASKSRWKLPASASDRDSDSSNSVCTGESELESGEITSSSDEEPVAMQCDEDVQAVYGESHSHDVVMAEEEIVSKWPPCIRMIVTDSDIIDPGTLFIVTCTGATVGREKEMGHTVLIPDINISKAHAEIHFNEEEYQYYLTDLASQNGTFLNEERVSEPKVKSNPKVLGHGDTLQFGCTRLLLHIHDGMDTCDECEPGQVQAQLQAQNQQQKEIVILSKEEKLRQQKLQLKKIKKKYGLKNSAYEDNMAAINNPAYNDKAEERRKTVGSDNPHQPDEAPASVHRPISEENKGHKMLKKLGWTEGESLGKDNEGIRQPISVKFRANKSAGLGSSSVGEGSVEEVGDLHRRQKWLQVQRRYNKMDEVKATGSGHNKMTLTTPKWVQGETQET